MEFNYKKLGEMLAWRRTQQNLRQVDLVEKSDDVLKQPAISAIERGETRLAVDTLVEYCNALGIRADEILDPFLTAEPKSESMDVIVDPYVIQLAQVMSSCSSDTKLALLHIAEILQKLE